MSSERMVRIQSVENLRIPEEGSSAQGKSGPKERPKAYPMDNRLKFRYHQISYEGSSDAGGADEHGVGGPCPSTKAVMQARPHDERLMCDGE